MAQYFLILRRKQNETQVNLTWRWANKHYTFILSVSFADGGVVHLKKVQQIHSRVGLTIFSMKKLLLNVKKVS